MTTGATIGRLLALKRAVLADGRVDWKETDWLLQVVRPLAAKHGFLFEDYERLLKKCRADGKITRYESDQLAYHLDFLCSYLSNRRLKFWIVVMTALLLAVAALAIGERMCKTASQVATMVAPTDSKESLDPRL